ncbi:putative TIM-barrel fold metal-dependent hydrolase [Mycobacterium sp. JS623]|uniref:amidohydrolase family protein n=1 Tax=Mycobacterium sp. JS623 TaxID=212767 RepID=UPI0002A5730E|nr:amidohydrolase family protein [Mycobacterium sp. JS623]AGB23794.1 putative TIM-barrel fold metal-dependent hydrolase [Mycobacterium sp. JS623]
MKVVGLEEHFATPELIDAWQALALQWRDVGIPGSVDDELRRRLVDLDVDRIAAMDATGLDVSVVSMTTPGLQNLDPPDAVALQSVCNDRLADAVRRHPDRLQGFATLATPRPDAAAAELDRAVRELGFNGAMLYGRTRERNLDHRDFWPIFEAAEALNAPLYLHPQPPPPAVRAAYYRGLGDEVDAALATHGYGWHYDAGLQLLRLILGGVLDRFPGLQLILGHWGEVMLFYLDRIDRMSGIASLDRPVSEYVRDNVFVTPGGVFSQRYLQWTLDVVGADRILFASDYPYVMVPDGGSRRFLEQAEISETDREMIASGNWEKLCAGIRR